MIAALILRKLWIGQIKPPYYCQTGYTFDAEKCEEDTEECKLKIECIPCPENGLCND